jgi:hypothetical protein
VDCSDLDAAKAFAQNRKPKPKPPMLKDSAESVAPIPVEGETAYKVRDCLQAQERSIAAESKDSTQPSSGTSGL